MTTSAPRSLREILPAEAAVVPTFAQVDKARLMSLTESVGNMGHWYWNLASGAMSWSDQIYRITNRDPGTFTLNADSSWEVIHPDDRQFVAAQFDKSIANGSPIEFDARFVRPAGDIRNVIFKCQPELSETGVPVALFGVLTDVTDAFSTIRAIQDQHEMLDLAAELAHLGHWVWSADRDALTFCSEQLAHIHELSPDVFLGRFSHPSRIVNVIDTEYREAYNVAIGAALSAGTSYQIEYKLETRFATIRHIKEIGQPIFDDKGKLVRFIGTVQDISEAKRREGLLTAANQALETQALALKRSETKFRDIVEGSIQGIVILRGTRIVFANNSFAKILGMTSAEEVLAIDDARRLLPKGMAADANLFWAEATAGRLDGQTQRSLMRGIDGRAVWIDAVGRLIDWEGATAFLLTIVDVTARHLADQALAAKSKELEDLNLQKDKLFSIIAHDLKGPFNSVLGFAGLLAAKARTMSREKVTEYADIVYSAATSVHDLLDNLLTWAAVQMRSTDIRPTIINLRALTDESFDPLKTMAAEKNIDVRNAVTDVDALGDEAMVRIVLRNLISNGIKFTPKGGQVTIAAQPLHLRDGRAGVTVSVRDTGVGMTQETIDELFSFTRKMSRNGTQGERGTGLGLFLCRDIVDRHGGQMAVESTLSEGTTFRFSLPAPGVAP